MRPNSGRNFSSEGPTCDTVAPNRRQCRECDVRTATRWYSWCCALFESFSVSVFVYGTRRKSIRSKHVRIVSLHRTRPLVDTSSVSLRSVGTLLQCAHKGDAVGSSRINCVVRSSLLRFASVSCVCFFTRHCLLFEPTIYLGSARRWNANVQSPACASIGRVGSLPAPFSRACVVCGF